MAKEISRKIGRCILRLQQYEILLKAMLSSKDIHVYGDTGESNHEERKNEVATKTLGQLMGELTGSYLGADESEEDQYNNDDQLDPSRLSFRMRFSMLVEDRQGVESELKQLVNLRNELVHHFLERFDLKDESSLMAANVYLEEAYKEIDERFHRLCNWAESMDKVRLQAKTFFESYDFIHFSSYGAFPEKPVDWPKTPIIRLLTQAEDSCRLDGWTKLGDAISFVRKQRPDLGPKKYGCSSWRHVLHESGMFDIDKRQDVGAGEKQVWFRSKLNAK